MSKKVANKNGRVSATKIGLLVGVAIIVGLVIMIWYVCMAEKPVKLSQMYYCGDDCGGASDDFVLMPLNAAKYADLVTNGESFVVFIDQDGCVAANEMQDMIMRYMAARKMRFYRMKYDEMKKTGLKEDVRFYPSVVIVDAGRPVAWLEADSARDEAMYRDYDALAEWLDGHLVLAQGAK